MTEPIVLAAKVHRTNASLIADVARLGWLQKDYRTLDPTFGLGNWWTTWRPDDLTTRTRKIDGSDFTAMEFPDDSFEAIGYDPPYVAPGGRKTTGMAAMHSAYGMDDTPPTPDLLQDLIDCGLRECFRVVEPRRKKRGGVVLVKCQNYVWSGRMFLGAHRTMQTALDIGFTVLDEFIHIDDAPRPQPERTRKCPIKHEPGDEAALCAMCEGTGRIASRQHHARRNLSNLIVLAKPLRASRTAKSPTLL
jgi:hypothetical protein